jgi:hypothetical protein
MRILSSFILAAAFLAVAFTGAAQQYTAAKGTFILELLYSSGDLFQGDRGITFVADPFVPPTSRTYSLYTIELYDENRVLLASSPIDQREKFTPLETPDADPQEEGEVLIRAPFDERTRRFVIKNERAEAVFEASYSEENLCNRNDVCEPQLGEKSAHCSIDCEVTLAPPGETAQPSSEEKSRATFWILLLVLAVSTALLVTVGVILYRIWHRQREDNNSPPPADSQNISNPQNYDGSPR